MRGKVRSGRLLAIIAGKLSIHSRETADSSHECLFLKVQNRGEALLSV